MGKVSVLSPDLASQIAAGEVVERPSSALKELLENAVDAGASRCSVEVEGGGITRISVLDDGCGMSEEDARVSLQRHATSKLHALSDLEDLSSYGFRGEALPSIASVSRLLVRTRTREESAGVELRLEGSLDPKVSPTGCAVGTLVEVRDLFFNVPARRKFLRSTGTESGHISDVVEALALSRPEVAISLTRDGRRIRNWHRARSREERVLATLGVELAACRGERGPLVVEAFLSPPERARNGAGGLKILVNERPVRDRALAVAVAQAYGSVLERGRYPQGVVYLDLPPQLVDFNVHPQKLELRFADPRAVSEALYKVLSAQLAAALSLPPGGRSTVARPQPAAAPEPREAPRLPLPSSGPPETVRRPAPTSAPAVPGAARPPSGAPARPRSGAPEASPPVAEAALPTLSFGDRPPPPRETDEVAWSSLQFIAQARRTFLICEGPEGLYILDQHAAAERVTFGRLKQQHRRRAVASQALLLPVEVEVSLSEADFVEEHGSDLSALGIELRRRGERWVSVHAIPQLLCKLAPEQLLQDVLSEAQRQGGRDFSAAVDRALATLACHGSLRAGDPVSRQEAEALLKGLDETEFAGHCPHGRPIVSFTSFRELERKVGRR